MHFIVSRPKSRERAINQTTVSHHVISPTGYFTFRQHSTALTSRFPPHTHHSAIYLPFFLVNGALSFDINNKEKELYA